MVTNRRNENRGPLNLGARLIDPPRMLLVAATIAVVLHVTMILARSDVYRTDFAKFHYSGAVSLRTAGSPFTHVPNHENARRYPYPPMLAYLLLPLAWFDVRTATHLWFTVDFGLTSVLAWQLALILAPSASVSERIAASTVILGWLSLYPPQIFGNQVGQVHNVIAVAALASLLSVQAGKQHNAGLLLAFATLVKGFPGLLIAGYWFGDRSRRAALIAVVAGLLFTLAALRHHQQYAVRFLINSALPDILAAEVYVSIPAMAKRLFIGWAPPEPLHAVYCVPLFNSPLVYKCVMAVSAAIVFLLLAWRVMSKSNEGLLFATFLSGSALLTPPFGFYHLNLAVIAAAICFRNLAQIEASRARNPAPASASWTSNKIRFRTLIVALFLTMLPPLYWVYPDFPSPWLNSLHAFLHTRWGLFLLTPPTYGLAMIFLVSATLPITSHKPSPAVHP